MRYPIPSVVIMVLLVGCTDATSLRLIVDSDLALGDEVDEIGVTIHAEGNEVWAASYPISRGDPLPQTLTVLPGNEVDGELELSVTALRAKSLVLTARRWAAFTKGEEQEERVCLWRRCIGASDVGCVTGRCDSTGGDGDADADSGTDGGDDADDRGDVDGDAESDADGDGETDADIVCVPECSAAECGPDGCGGSCGTCARPLSCCSGTCVNTARNNAHCGACDRLCTGVGRSCSSSDCVCDDATHEDCGTYCADTSFDVDNCGVCGVPCPPSHECDGSVCRAEVAGDVAAQRVSGFGSCTTGPNSQEGSVGVDEARHIYVLMRCDDVPYAAVSTDGGLSYSGPNPISVESVPQLAVAGGPPGRAHLMLTTLSGRHEHVMTHDSGASWSTPEVVLGSGADDNESISVAVDGDGVFLASESPSDVRVWRNDTAGVGPFSHVDVPHSAAHFDVLADPSTGDVWLATESVSLYLLQSIDGGVSFGSANEPGGTLHHADFTLGGGTIFAAGSSEEEFYAIPTSTPDTSRTITGGTDATGSERAISANPEGNLYAVCLSGATVTLDRVDSGSSSVTASVPLGAGEHPGVAAIPGVDAAVVVFTSGSEVHAALVTF